MHPCPSCAAPLDEEGICTSCGALARGFFRDLDLGPPQIAAAVVNGLDFYQLLGVAPEADVRSVARRYRQLPVPVPDDPSSRRAERQLPAWRWRGGPSSAGPRAQPATGAPSRPAIARRYRRGGAGARA